MSGVVLLFLLALSWEVVAQAKGLKLLPPPSSVLMALVSLVLSGEIVGPAAATLSRCLMGYGLAAVLAIPVGMAMGRHRVVYGLLEPFIETLRPIPSAAVIPAAIALLGFDNDMRIGVITFGATWPILLNTIHGVQTIDPVLIETGHTFNLKGWSMVRKIILPAALPSIATGLRISLAVSLILAITVEMIAGGSGLGFFILDSERAFQYPSMYSGIVVLGGIGFTLNALFLMYERRYLSWAKRAVPLT